jgi:hypothetical protein
VIKFPVREGVNLAIPAYHVPTRAEVVYTGDVREMSSGARGFMQLFLRTLYPQFNPTMYRHELRFLEADAAYWLPVQEPLRGDFVEELTPGDTIVIFVLYHGAYTSETGPVEVHRMFAVTEFESRRQDRQWLRNHCPLP